MRRILLVVFMAVMMGLTYQIQDRVVAQDVGPYYENGQVVEFNPVCRHKALYWGSMIGEDYEVRIAWGKLGGVPHVQPQIKILNTWYFFKIKNNQLVFISMPKHWKLGYYMPWIEFALYHNVWMVQKNGETWQTHDMNEYQRRLNKAVDVLRNGVHREELDGLLW